ncbi:DUF3710 domain-containing protein [Streptomyces roseoverticillatus]|uniref:DUF3710 domain-containing protein n=1 Tax=Streptomyces roseoverticillatus TaxID=66429 RepID=UPI001F20B5B8|nr:DUF3710 domain-containing protein [Streptomyces roseoverticillatus]MCF3105440.1 DUF3710 domain-containing protein [Streptomyces roseoverticillatus]
MKQQDDEPGTEPAEGAGNPAESFEDALRDLYRRSTWTTQTEFGNALGTLSKSTISRFLSGQRLPRKEFLDQLFRVLAFKDGSPVTAETEHNLWTLYLERVRRQRPDEYKLLKLEHDLSIARASVTDLRSQLQQSDLDKAGLHEALDEAVRERNTAQSKYEQALRDLAAAREERCRRRHLVRLDHGPEQLRPVPPTGHPAPVDFAAVPVPAPATDGGPAAPTVTDSLADIVATHATCHEAVPERVIVAHSARLQGKDESEAIAAVRDLDDLMHEIPAAGEQCVTVLATLLRHARLDGKFRPTPRRVRDAAAETVAYRPDALADIAVNLSGADLSRTNLRAGSLRGANLRRTKFDRADLRQANLMEADFSLASLARADLAGANLSHARGLTVEQLLTARLDPETKLPDYVAGDRQLRSHLAAVPPFSACPPRSTGPWDRREVLLPAQGRIDLGGLFVPNTADAKELRLEFDGSTLTAVTVVINDSAIQLQAFAAPRSTRMWENALTDIAAGIFAQGGLADATNGPFGPELQARLAIRLPNGIQGVQHMRFIGVDGPRWYLRGAISGAGAVHTEAGGAVERIFNDTVVARGFDAMAPQEPIPLELPEDMLGCRPQAPQHGVQRGSTTRTNMDPSDDIRPTRVICHYREWPTCPQGVQRYAS